MTTTNTIETRRLATEMILLGERILAHVSAFEPATPLRAKMTTIISLVAAHYGFSRDRILKQDRQQRIVEARQVAMFFCRELTTASLQEIGDEFQRDHGTISHAIREINGRCDVDEKFKTLVGQLRKQLEGTP